MKIPLISTLLLLSIFLSPNPTLAQSCEDSSKCSDSDSYNKYLCLSRLAAQCQTLLNTEQQKENTLKSQLIYIDLHIKFTQLKIDETNAQISKLKREIDDLSNRIIKLSTTLDNISQAVLITIVQTYKYSNTTSPINLLFSAHGFTDLLERLKYIQVAQEYNKKKLYELQATQLTYNDQKQDKQTRQVETEQLSKDLGSYRTQLDQQKKAKDELLNETQNNENKYQQLIAKLQADTDSISRALTGGGIKLGPVNKGDRIASVGDSGCSTGAHLHFEAITPARIAIVQTANGKQSEQIVDEKGQPINEGLDHRVDPRTYIEQGKFAKPVAEYTGNDACSYSLKPTDPSCQDGNISTRFKQSYLMGIHTGIDIVDHWGAPVYAADNGDSYEFSDSRVCTVPGTSGTVGKGIAIDHHNGIVTLYWHIP